MSKILFKGKRTFELNDYELWSQVERNLDKVVPKFHYALNDKVEELGLESYGYMEPEVIKFIKNEEGGGFIVMVRYRFMSHDNISTNKFKLSYPRTEHINRVIGKLNLTNMSQVYCPIPSGVAIIILGQRVDESYNMSGTYEQLYFDLYKGTVADNVLMKMKNRNEESSNVGD